MVRESLGAGVGEFPCVDPKEADNGISFHSVCGSAVFLARSAEELLMFRSVCSSELSGLRRFVIVIVFGRKKQLA
jgi:hypothetical protein